MLEWIILIAPFFGACLLAWKKWYKLAPVFPLISLAFAFFVKETFIDFNWLPLAGFGLWLDGLSRLLVIVVALVGVLVLWYSIKYMEKEQGLRRFYFLMLIFMGFMLGVVLSTNLFQMFIFWELLSLCSYFLIGFRYDKQKARTAAIQSFIITRLGDVAFLAGIFILYLNVGSFSIPVILAAAIPSKTIWAVGILFLIGVFAKCAQFPLQTWLPDAMEAPTPVSALLHSATLVQAGIFLLARLFPLFARLENWHVVAYPAIISAIITAFLALGSTDIKRVLAYSTSSQISYMLVAVVSCLTGVAVAMYLLVIHALFKSLLFLSAGNVTRAAGVKDIRKLSGMASAMPFTAALFAVGAFTLAGFPPMGGFWGKEFVLEVLKWPLLKELVNVGFVLTIIYAVRPVYYFYFGKKIRKFKEASHNFLLPAAFLAVFIFVATFILPYYARVFLEAVLPFELLLTPFVLIGIGLVGFWLYFKYMPMYGKRELKYIADNLGYFYDRVVIGIVEGTAKILSAKERVWDKAHAYYLNLIVLGPFKHFNKLIKKLEQLNPKTAAGGLVVAIVGLIILALVVAMQT